MDQPEYLTLDQVAQFFQVGRSTVKRWVKRGLLAPTYINGIPRYRRTELERFTNDGDK